jgi:putative endonuclease
VIPQSPRSAKQQARAELGLRAEDMACEHLRGLGFEIIGRNIRVGRLEIDIIARRPRLIVFCEVRSRTSDWIMTPAQSIDPAKVRRIRSAAAQWLREADLGPVQARFDVVSVTFDVPGGRLNHLDGAF